MARRRVGMLAERRTGRPTRWTCPGVSVCVEGVCMCVLCVWYATYGCAEPNTTGPFDIASTMTQTARRTSTRLRRPGGKAAQNGAHVSGCSRLRGGLVPPSARIECGGGCAERVDAEDACSSPC